MKIEFQKVVAPLSIHVVWGLIITVLLVAIHFLPPGECIFHQITGYPCLTCGISRAADSFWAGDFGSMFYFNPLIVTFGTGLFLFSLLKLLEYILHLRIRVNLSQRAAVLMRVSVGLSVVANWLFLIASKR
jgi:hypothetical protein